MKDYLLKITSSIKDSLIKLEKNKEKCLIIVNSNNKLQGTLTDGDLRRAIINGALIKKSVKKYIKKNPIFFSDNEFKKLLNNENNLFKLLEKTKNNHIDIIPIVNKSKRVINIVKTKSFEKFDKINDLSKIPLVIMAGGRGTRLRPFTDSFPKPLIPIKNTTAVEFIMQTFTKFGVKKFILSINYKKDLIKSYFKGKKTHNINYIEEKKPLGTAGSLKLVQKKIKTDMFIINCDTICKFNLSKFYDYHKNNNYDFTIAVASKNHEFPYGSCRIDKKGNLKKIVEKPNTQHLVNIGLYILKPKIINLIPSNQLFDMDELIRKIKQKKLSIGVFPVNEENWIDIGEWTKYNRLDKRYI